MNTKLTAEQQENLVALIHTLRGNEYRQTTNKLRDIATDCFCVHGVACDLYLKRTGNGRWQIGLPLTHYQEFWLDNNASSTAMLFTVAMYYGLDQVITQAMMKSNDTLKKSFSEIADMLEENWLQKDNLEFFENLQKQPNYSCKSV